MNAIASKPAVIKAMGVPFNASGTRVSANCSRMVAKIINAIEYPMAVDMANTIDCIKL